MSAYSDVRELLTQVRIYAGIPEFDALERPVLSILAQVKMLEDEVLAQAKEASALRRAAEEAEQLAQDAVNATPAIRREAKRAAYKHAIAMVGDPEMLADRADREVAVAALESVMGDLDAEAFDARC